MTPIRSTALAALAFLSMLALPALADSDWDDTVCQVPAGATAMDSTKAVAIAESLGYRIAKYEMDDGCIELKGTDANGARVKLRLDPVTGAIIPAR